MSGSESDRILAKLDALDERASEHREEMLSRLGSIDVRLATLETRHHGARDTLKLIGWIAVFIVSVAAIALAQPR